MNKVGEKYSVIVLASGMSQRMGYPKPWLKTNQCISFTEHIINSYKKAGVSNIVVVLNHAFAIKPWKKETEALKVKAHVVLNKSPQLGRIHTIKMGLPFCMSDKIYLHNVDTPFVNYKTIKSLQLSPDENAVVIPVYNNCGGHPVLINSDAIVKINGNYNLTLTLKDILGTCNVKRINVDDAGILNNLNTRSQYLEALNEFI